MQNVTMYCTAVCPYCVAAERLLKSKGVENIDKIRIDEHPHLREEMMTKTGRRTVPQIYIGETHVGGFDDINALDKAGGLMPLLNAG
jgi:glutaredoxin 3